MERITEDRRIKALPRILLRLALGAAALCFVAFAALVLWLRYVALPNIDGYREVIAASVERASGMRVTAHAIRGGWYGLRPAITLEGLQIADAQGKAALDLQRAEVSLSWWALFSGRVRFHDVDLYRPELVLRRGADGLIYLADKPLNAGGGDDGAFTQWLLSQPRMGVHDAALVWRDDFLGTPAVRLTQVEIEVERHRGRHHASLRAVPPPQLARAIDVRAELAFSRDGPQWRAAGELYAETLDADLGKLRDYLPVPETLRSGIGALRVWAQVSGTGVKEVVADLAMRDARAQLAADALPLELATVSGRAIYRAEAEGFTFETRGLRFRLASGMEAQPGNFSLARATTAPGKVPRVEVHADGIDVKIAAALIDYFPLPRDLKGQVQRFAPRGRISDASIAWSEDGARTYSVKGRFEDFGVNAVDNLPGASGISGSIEGTQDGGRLVIAAHAASLELAEVFRAPLAFDALEAQARWRHESAALVVEIEDAHFANADAEGHLSGSWRSLPGAKVRSPGFADLKGTFSRANAARAANYLPNRIAQTRDWLERSLLEGELARGSFELKGDLYNFPFGRDAPGRFLFEGDVRKARLRYHPAWPSVDAIDGNVRFENRRMEIHAERAAIFSSRVKSASAVIEDLSQKPPLLVFQGDMETSGADTVRFLRESPLVNGPGAFTRAVSIEGPGRFKVRLDYPLWGTDPMRVAGEYQFAGATATAGRSLVMSDVNGRLAFTERGVRAPELTGNIFGRRATLAMATEGEGRVVTTIEGQMEAAALNEFLAPALVAHMAGAFDWKARVVAGRQGVEIGIASNLKGLAVTLPEPLAKPAETERAFSLQVQRPATDTESWLASLAGGIHGRFNRAAGERWQVALKGGAPIDDEPLREGLWLYGSLPSLDIDAWLAVFAKPRETADAAPAAGGLELRGLDLKLERLHYLDRDFAQMQAQLERSGEQWSGRLASPLVAGEVQWNPSGRGSVAAKLERLAIPEPRPQAAGAEREPGELPALDVSAERFDFRGRTLGALTLRAKPAGDDWRIDNLDIVKGSNHFTSSGLWRRTGAGPITTLELKLDANNLNALFSQFGYGDYVKRGSGHLEGTLVWPGQPSEFGTALLSGALKVDARGGQFAKIEPGAGKLLGLISLQSLPRRATFDFRDVFSDGFAFDRIHGDVKVAHGVLLTDDFEISGPSAFVSLAGEVSLPQETQVLTLRVVPEVGEGMALAATVFGTPVLGLSTLLVSKLLKNPIGKAVAYEYQVTGSWDNPLVTRTSAPPAKSAAASPATAPSAQQQ